MNISRRGFLGALAAAFVADPERLLWVPGKKLISIPSITLEEEIPEPMYDEISMTTLLSLQRDMPTENFFVDSAFFARQRAVQEFNQRWPEPFYFSER